MIRMTYLYFVLIALIIPVMARAAEVNPDGSLGHTVEIKLPPGTNGVAPKLALDYNSNGGNGIVGQGWRLTGLPVITRDPSFGIKFNSTDHYTAENGRLVDVGGMYHYEDETFSRFMAYGTPGNPTYWIETRPDGTKFYYGNYNDAPSANSLAKGKGNAIRAWALSKVEDVHGNYYTIEYRTGNTSGELYPRRIYYTRGSGISTFRAIEFVYENRNDVYPHYTYGSEVQTNLRLKEIDIYTDVPSIFGYLVPILGDQVRRYVLSYSDSVVSSTLSASVPLFNFTVSRLTSVQEFGSDGSSLPPTLFTWSEGGGILNQYHDHTGEWPSRLENIYPGDYNGDGLDDPYVISMNEDGGWKLYVSYINPGNPGLWNYYLQSEGGWPSECEYVIPCELNGDGLTDTYIVSSHTSNRYIDISYGSNFSRYNAPGGGDMLPVDIDGDGRNEVMIVSRFCRPSCNCEECSGDSCGSCSDSTCPAGWAKLYSFNAGTATFSELTGASMTFTGKQVKLHPGDYNGDGKTDLYVVYYGLTENGCDTEEAGWEIYLSNGSGFEGPVSQGSSTVSDADCMRIIPADFNGDGLDDIYKVSGCYHGIWNLELSNGAGFTQVSWGGWPSECERPYIGDYNGDGFADMYVLSDHDNNEGVFHYISNGNSFYPSDANYSFHTDWPSSDERAYIGDYNGDGKSDAFILSGSQKGWWLYQSTGSSHTLITGITSGTGGSSQITYEPAAWHKRGGESAIVPQLNGYPDIANTSRRYLVTRLAVSDGRGATYSNSYAYHNGKLHLDIPQERRDLCFEKVTQSNEQSQERTITYYKQDNPRFAGRPVRTESYAGNGALMKRVTLQYNNGTHDTTTAFGTHFVKLTRETTENLEMGTPVNSVTRSLVYDDYGNPTSITESTSDPSIPAVTTSIAYKYDQGNWIVNRPEEVKKATSDTTLQWQRFTYTGNTISLKEDWLDTENRWLPTWFTYEAGAVNSVKNALGQTTAIEYDDDYHAFPVEVSDPMGHTVRKTYDPETGNVLTETDPAGNTRKAEYDEFGRLSKAYNASGDLIKEVLYHDDLLGNANGQHVETLIHNSVTECRFQRTYFDGLGREFRTVTSAYTVEIKENEKTVTKSYVRIVDKEFDAQGRVSRQSNPYIAVDDNGTYTPVPGTQFYAVYSYDPAGRVIRKEHPESTPENIVASGYSYAADAPYFVAGAKDPRGNWSYSRVDARGKLVRKDEPEGARVSYVYDPVGRLVETRDAFGRITAIAYDSIGRKTSIDDPNTGKWTYTYDDAGRLLAQKDANGQTRTFQYDNASRIVLEDNPGDTDDVKFVYDESSSDNGMGRLTSVKDGAGETRFAYDEEGRAVYWRQSVDGLDFSFRMGYDIQGRATSLVYPDGTEILKQYDQQGYLKAVTTPTGGAYVQYGLIPNAAAGDAHVRRRTGNGVETIIGFDPATLRPTTVVTNIDTTKTVIENSVYTYDKAGNISQISDTFNPALSQTFGYDALNRLTTAKGAYGNHAYVYDAAGNLTGNHRGALSYDDPSHPFAVTHDGTGAEYSYDANGNMVTQRGRALRYNAKNQLLSIDMHGELIQTFAYDHSGSRVRRKTSDGTTIYTIGGLYELVKSPGREDHHTKFIHGIRGDLAAQRTSVNAPLVARGRTFFYDGMYASNPFTRVLCTAYIQVDDFLSKPGNVVYVIRVMVLLALLAILFLVFYYRIYKRQETSPAFRWMGDVAVVVLLCFITTFALPGCAQTDFNDLANEDPPAQDGGGTVPGDEGGTGGGGEPGSGGDGDTTSPPTAGLPTVGIYYFHPDHAGSIRMLTNANGNVVTRLAYTPYGERVASQCSGQGIFHQGYTGQVDDGTGLLFYNARYYDPGVGRFTSTDSFVPNPTQAISFNRYAYVNGNPINYCDPGGHWSVSGTWNKVVDAVANPSDTGHKAWNITKQISYSASGYQAYKQGGWKGFSCFWHNPAVTCH